MATADDGLFWIEVEGASKAELRRGIAAARAVLDGTGIADAGPLFRAHFKFVEDGPMTEEEMELCRQWKMAEKAAVEACCGGWRKRPSVAYLSLFEVEREERAEAEDLAEEKAERQASPHYNLTQPAPLEFAF